MAKKAIPFENKISLDEILRELELNKGTKVMSIGDSGIGAKHKVVGLKMPDEIENRLYALDDPDNAPYQTQKEEYTPSFYHIDITIRPYKDKESGELKKVAVMDITEIDGDTYNRFIKESKKKY